MITPRGVLEHVLAEPFQPFRVNMASRRHFDVRHPEMIKVGRSTFTIYSVIDGDQSNGHRWQDVSFMLIESIEPLDMRLAAE